MCVVDKTMLQNYIIYFNDIMKRPVIPLFLCIYYRLTQRGYLVQ